MYKLTKGHEMKKLLNKIFNRAVISDVKLSSDKLAQLLNEPLPTAEDVLAWYNKNIPAND